MYSHVPAARVANLFGMNAQRDHDSASLYRTIADDLKAAIRSGVYPAGARLPSESELATQYDASRGTIRQAFAALAADGVISSRRGARRRPRGTRAGCRVR